MEATAPIRRAPRGLFRVLPFVVSAGLFLSGLFSLFAPLPLLMLGVTKGLLWALAAGLVNSAFVYLLGGPELFQFYLIGVALMGLALPFFLRRKAGLEKSLGLTWTTQVLILFALVLVYAMIRGHGPIQEIELTLGNFFDKLLASLTPEAQKQLIGEMSPEEWKHRSTVEFPLALLTVVLVTIWVNLHLLVTLMGRVFRAQMGLDRKSFLRWKNADWLIWPTIATWAVFLFAEGTAADVALGVFKLLMAVYGIQGLAILGFCFDAWKVRGIFRLLLYFFALFLVLPLVISIGFFDQWFDFRGKIRQS